MFVEIRQALDFLKAPDRMAGLMDEGVLRWLVMPATTGGSDPGLRYAAR